MENDNSCVDILKMENGVDMLKLLSDFEKNMADESSIGETTGMSTIGEVQVIDSSDNAVFNLENYQTLNPITDNIDFKIHSPYLKLKRKIHRLDSTKKSMRKELNEMKKEIGYLKEEVSDLHNKLNDKNGQKYKKNTVMGQLGFIREILMDIQSRNVKM